MLVANMDVSQEPTLEGLFEKSKIIERDGRKIGLIGVILETTDVSLPGLHSFPLFHCPL